MTILTKYKQKFRKLNTLIHLVLVCFVTYSSLSSNIFATEVSTALKVPIYEQLNSNYTTSFGYTENNQVHHYVRYEFDEDTYITVELLNTSNDISTSINSVNGLDIVKFDNIFNDTNIYYEVSDFEIKELLELESSQSPMIYSYVIKVNGGTISPTLNGGYIFNPENKKLNSFNIPPLFMIDSKGSISYDIQTELTPISPVEFQNFNSQDLSCHQSNLNTSTYLFTIHPNQEWIKNKLRAFPILIDPSIVQDTQSEFASGTFSNTIDAGSTEASPMIKLSNNTSGEFTSEIINLGSYATINSIAWDIFGISSGDGEVPLSSNALLTQLNLNESSGNTANDLISASNGSLTGFGGCSDLQNSCNDSGWTNQNKRWGTGALKFDGVNDYLDIPNLNSETFSISLWFYPEANPNWPNTYNFIIDGLATSYMGVYINTNRLQFETYSGLHSDSIESGDITLNQWHHLVITYDYGQKTMYIDGVLQGSSYGPSSDKRIYGFGLNSDEGSQYQWAFKGAMDSIRIYERILGQSEVLSDFQAGSIDFQSRTSNDGVTWADWTSNSNGSSIEDTYARYLQYKAIFNASTTNASPWLDGVSVNYTEGLNSLNKVIVSDSSLNVIVNSNGDDAVLKGTIGANVQLDIKKKSYTLADIDLNMNSSRDLSGLTADVDTERGISFMHYDDGTNCGGLGCQYTDIPGAVGSTFTFYVPRDPQSDIGICIIGGADELSDFNEIIDETSCIGAGWIYSTGGTAGQYTVTKISNAWQVAGATATGGISISNDFFVSDTMTRLEQSQPSNHLINFGTVNGLLAETDSFIISFASGFNLVNIDYADIDLVAGGRELTLAGTATTNTWGVAVDSVTNNTITFTPPTTGSSTGYILGGEMIELQIGTNATSGVHQIINPLTSAEYEVHIRINNSETTETGEVTVPIVDDDTINISGYLDTTLTFDIDTTTETGNTVGTGDCDTQGGSNPCDSYEGAGDNLGYVVSVGEMTTNSVNKSHQTTVTHADGNNGVINSIFFDLETNAQGGAVVTVLSRYGGMYLDPSNILTSGLATPSTEIEVTEGSGRYGIQSVSGTHFVNSASGTVNIAVDCDGVENGVGGPAGNFYCGVTSLEPTEIFNTGTNPVEEARIEFGVGVAPSSTNATGTYEDYLTFIATGTF